MSAGPKYHGWTHMPDGTDPIPGLDISGGVLPSGSGSGWTRVAQPLISGLSGGSWEQGVVGEPTVLYDPGTATWTMWYTGGLTPAIGVATCTTDPTVPGNWTRYGGNPVLNPGWASGSSVTLESGTYYLYYYDALGGGNIQVATSTDGVTFGSPTQILASGSFGGTHGYANTCVWKEGSTWKLLVEASTHSGGGPPWHIYYGTSSSPTSGWTVSSGPISTLDNVSYISGDGGPNFAQIDGVITPQINGQYQLWYHLQNSTGGHEVSDIGHARGSAVPGSISFSGMDLLADRGAYETDQVADPNVLQVAGKSYLFYTGVENTVPNSYIHLATFNGVLEDVGSNVGTPTAFDTATIFATESRSSTSYGDLASIGPSVTINIGSNGIALVGYNGQLDGSMIMAPEISGANTLVAADDYALYPGTDEFIAGRTAVFTGLAPGSTTFTLKYRSAGGTHSAQRRSIWALAL